MEAVAHPGAIVVLDFGGQYAHLIANRIRRLGAFSCILPPETPASALRDAAGIILSGGPQSVYEPGSPQADPGIFALGVPVLGLCYGHQWVAQALGGAVRSAGANKEYGQTPVTVVPDTAVFQGLPEQLSVWMSHGDEVSALPPGFRDIASTSSCAHAAMADDVRRIFGIQWHIEVTHSEHGIDILRRFVALCSPKPWSIESFAAHVGEQVRAEVGDRKVFMLVSGGVDSTVAFTLLSRVLGADRVQGLLVDTGMMRKGEVAAIGAALGLLKLPNLRVEDASEEFFAALEGAVDPEQKRRIIGDTFLAVQRRVSEEMGLRMEEGWMLGQGTIYPDTIETGGTRHADHIKTHHNRVPAIQALMDKGFVIEPLKELYKDEVRILGEELGLPHALVWRHPFPGPGLGVRILCAGDDAPVLPPTPSLDVPCAVLPVRSVGVQGDGRTYRHALALFASDPCTATPAHWGLATRIPNTLPAFNRVLLCTSHASSPVELHATPGTLTRTRADLLREADAIVHAAMEREGLLRSIWQFPVVLLPCGVTPGGQSIVLRPVESQEAMTANAAALPPDMLRRVTHDLLQLPGIDCVFYDLTSKPPGTIEWE